MQRTRRRFGADKVQNVQLLTAKQGQYQQFSLIMQFNDIIVSASLSAKDHWVEWCQPTSMVRRHLVRGYNDQIYYAETSGKNAGAKIVRLELSANKIGEVKRKEIYDLPGSQIAAFETDCENIQDDSKEEHVKQAFYIFDDKQKIYHVVDEDGVKFNEDKIIDFSMHDKLRDVNKLSKQHWSHVHITSRALTFDGEIYSLQTDLSSEIGIPESYFG